ncbi:MAG: SRPBCC family protein [Gemmatimonadaceae bacterium]
MKWLLIVVLAIAAIVLGVTIVGMALPQSHVAQRSAHLSAPPERVWSAISDVAAYPTWRSDVSSVEMLTSGGGKVAWREISPKGSKLAFEATTSDAPSHLVTFITDKGIPFGGSWDYRIMPEGTGSRITITENGEVYNPFFRFVSRFVLGHTATLDSYLKSLAARSGDKYPAAGKS